MLNKTTSELAKASVSKLVAHLEMIGKWREIKLAKSGKNLSLLLDKSNCPHVQSKVGDQWLRPKSSWSSYDC